jgi:hypothetical protein
MEALRRDHPKTAELPLNDDTAVIVVDDVRDRERALLTFLFYVLFHLHGFLSPSCTCVYRMSTQHQWRP